MDKIKAFFNNKIYRKNFMIFIILPIILELAIEILNRGSVIGGIKYLFTHPVQFYCNMMFILVTMSVGLLVKRRMFYVSLISGIWLLMGIVNRVLLEVRVTPFNASDLKLIDAATNLIDQYFTPFLIMLTIVGLGIVVLILVLLFIKGKKIDYSINYWKNLIIVGIALVVCMASTNIAIDTGFLATKFTNLTNAYNEYGFVYCFGSGLFNTGVKKPSDYSQDTIDEIIDKIDSGREEKDTINPVDKKPNIIFLQLESCFFF